MPTNSRMNNSHNNNSVNKSNQQYFVRCQSCNEIQSFTWTKCPKCYHMSQLNQSSFFKRGFLGRGLRKQVKAQTKHLSLENESRDERGAKIDSGMDVWVDEADENEDDNSSELGISLPNLLMNRSQKSKNEQLKQLVQNNVRIEKNQKHTNFQIDGSIGKYLILLIMLGIFFYFLLMDLEILKNQEISQKSKEIDSCFQDYKRGNCESIISSSNYNHTFYQYCKNWEICMNEDPTKNVKIIQILSKYLADVMDNSMQSLSSKVTGIILLIVFSIITFSHILSCFCPKRKQD